MTHQLAKHYLPHHDRPDPSDLHECLPIIALRWCRCRGMKRDDWKIVTRYQARREETMGDSLIMFGFVMFRYRPAGFILCLN